MIIVNAFKNHWQLAALTAAVFLLWSFQIMAPLKILVVFLHEASHAFTALLTGGSVENISLSIHEGGSVTSRGGNFFLIASAGYLGSLVLGALLFAIAIKTNADRIAVAVMGVVMLLLTVIYMRELFPIAFCVIVGGAFLAAARFLPHKVNDLILRVIGLTSMMYVPYDIFSDTLARSNAMSDARIIATYFGGPTVFWGALWLVISLFVIAATLRFTLTEPSNITLQMNKLKRAG